MSVTPELWQTHTHRQTDPEEKEKANQAEERKGPSDGCQFCLVRTCRSNTHLAISQRSHCDLQDPFVHSDLVGLLCQNSLLVCSNKERTIINPETKSNYDALGRSAGSRGDLTSNLWGRTIITPVTYFGKVTRPVDSYLPAWGSEPQPSCCRCHGPPRSRPPRMPFCSGSIWLACFSASECHFPRTRRAVRTSAWLPWRRQSLLWVHTFTFVCTETVSTTTAERQGTNSGDLVHSHKTFLDISVWFGLRWVHFPLWRYHSGAKAGFFSSFSLTYINVKSFPPHLRLVVLLLNYNVSQISRFVCVCVSGKQKCSSFWKSREMHNRVVVLLFVRPFSPQPSLVALH